MGTITVNLLVPTVIFLFDLLDTFIVKTLLFLVYLTSNKGIKLRGLVRQSFVRMKSPYVHH